MITVRLDHRAGAAICAVAGNLDAFTVSTFRAVTASLARSNTPVVIDLIDVDFIDGSGLGALVSLVRRCHDAGVATACCANRRLRRALVEVGFDRLVDVATDNETALRSVARELVA